MGVIYLDHVRAGMVVASDVKNLDAMVLLPAGCIISGKHLQLLRTWGITEVDVKGMTEQKTSTTMREKIDPQILARVEIQTNDLFHHAGRAHPMLKELSALCTLRKARGKKKESNLTSEKK